MNTKTDGISSGLVAVAWLYYNESEYIKVDNLLPHTDDSFPVVSLSDAEAIISAKDAEIERLKESVSAFKQMIFTNTDRSMTIQDRFFTAHEGGFVSDNNFDFDAGLQVSGDFVNNEKDRYAQMIACTLNDYSKQSAALKLAKEALSAASSFIANGIELGYIRMPDDDVPDPAHRTPQNVNEALAAIDEVLKGE